MALWDVFHGDRLEAERSLTTEDVRACVQYAAGLVRDEEISFSGSP